MPKHALGGDPEYRAGLNLYSAGEYEKSVSYYLAFIRKLIGKKGTSRGVRTFPFWEFWNNLANSYTRVGEYDKAEICYLQSISCFGASKMVRRMGVVFYNYACMLFFEKKSWTDLFKSYILFMLADRCGYKNNMPSRIGEYLVIDPKLMGKSTEFFFQSKLYSVLKKLPYLRQFVVSVGDIGA